MRGFLLGLIVAGAIWIALETYDAISHMPTCASIGGGC